MTGQRVTICGPNLFGAPETFHVHREGCRDLSRPLYRGIGEHWLSEFTSQAEVITCVYSDIMAENDEDDDAWTNYEQEFRFFPCVTLGREGDR